MANYYNHSLVHVFNSSPPLLLAARQELRSIRQLAEVSRDHLGRCLECVCIPRCIKNNGTSYSLREWGTPASMTGTQKQRVILEGWRTWGALGSVNSEESLEETQPLCWEVPLGHSPLQIRPSDNLQHSSSLLTTQLIATRFSFPGLTLSKGKDPTGSPSHTEDHYGTESFAELPQRSKSSTKLLSHSLLQPGGQNSQSRAWPLAVKELWQVCSDP